VLATYRPEIPFRSAGLGVTRGKPIELQRKDPPWTVGLGSKLKDNV